MKKFLATLFLALPFTVLAASELAPAPRTVSQPDPEKATFRLRASGGGGSATCVWTENGYSVLISNNHVFADQNTDGRFPVADYPLGVLLSQIGVEKTVEVATGTAVGGDEDVDLTVIVAPKTLPFAPLARTNAKPGDKVWHRGATSKYTGGLVLEVPFKLDRPCGHFASNLASIPGDSGAAVVNERGEVVGINCGRFGVDTLSPQRGSPVSAIRPVVRKFADPVKFPKLVATLKD